MECKLFHNSHPTVRVTAIARTVGGVGILVRGSPLPPTSVAVAVAVQEDIRISIGPGTTSDRTVTRSEAGRSRRQRPPKGKEDFTSTRTQPTTREGQGEWDGHHSATDQAETFQIIEQGWIHPPALRDEREKTGAVGSFGRLLTRKSSKACPWCLPPCGTCKLIAHKFQCCRDTATIFYSALVQNKAESSHRESEF